MLKDEPILLTHMVLCGMWKKNAYFMKKDFILPKNMIIFAI